MSDPFVGEIKMFAGNFSPRNFAYCTGQMMSIRQNQALFSILGNLYGGSLASDTFGLPNFSGRMPVGTGTLPGGSTFVSSNSGGAETVTLSQTNMPAHNHSLSVFGGLATSATIHGDPPPGVRDPYFLLANAGNATDGKVFAYTTTLTTVNALNFKAMSTWGGGGGEVTYPVRNPYLTVGFIICTSGQMCFRP